MLIDDYWLNELAKYNIIKVGLSCGLDSTVLLHNLASYPFLHKKLKAIHVNHGLSPNADIWQVHCERFCKKLSIELLSQKVQLIGDSNIEESARNARYSVFTNSLKAGECLVLAHHQNDQVETLLFNLFRGTGIDGLASIPQQRKLSDGDLIRPLLNKTRDDLHAYALKNNLEWIEDESNFNIGFSRNFIRHSILPTIIKKWPRAIQNISDCAIKCSEARDNLLHLALIDCPDMFLNPLQLNLDFVRSLANERLVNVIRSWLKYNGILSPSAQVTQRIIKELIYAKPDKIPKIVLGDIFLSRYRNYIYILKCSSEKESVKNVCWKDFPNPLYLSDGRIVFARLNEQGIPISENSEIQIRFRKGGETIKINGQNKKLKKVFQELGVLPWHRDYLPLLFVNGRICAVIGLINSDFDLHTNSKNYEIGFNC